VIDVRLPSGVCRARSPARRPDPPLEEHITVADFRLDAETRTEFGKGSARRTRRAGRIPAVLYGHGQDVVHLSLPAREFAAALRNGGANALLTIVLDGKEQLALTKAVQRDPLKRTHEHVDLLLVRRGEKTTVEVPIVIVGEVAPDTIPNHQLSTVSIEADATKLPDNIEVDVTGRSAGQNITAGELVLPRGATLITDPEALVIGFLGAPTAEALEAELAEAESEAGIEREESEESTAEATAAAEASVPAETGSGPADES
jgi:large subunit ribosomal protein L25